MKLWRDLRTNFMYWRFRNITRNRLRVQSWWNTRAANRGRTTGSHPLYRERGLSAYRPRPYRASSTASLWGIVFLMVALLTALTSTDLVPNMLRYPLGTLIVIAAIYAALRSR